MPASPPNDANQAAGADRASDPAFLVLGKIVRPHGVRGEMSLKILTDFPERIADLDAVYLGSSAYDEAGATEHEVLSTRRHREQLLIKLSDIPTRDEAALQRGKLLMVTLADAVPLEEGEFYLYQIIGAEVVSEDGEVLGTLKEVLETGANDVYVVTGGMRGEVLLPDIPEVILDVDVNAQRITVALPPGLLPDDA